MILILNCVDTEPCPLKIVGACNLLGYNWSARCKTLLKIQVSNYKCDKLSHESMKCLKNRKISDATIVILHNMRLLKYLNLMIVKVSNNYPTITEDC